MCWKCRQRPCTEVRHNGVRCTVHRVCSHKAKRTGRTKLRKKRTKGGLPHSHEYVCECGHTGWSHVKGVETLPLVTS